MTMFNLRQRIQRVRRDGERGSILILVVLSALIIIGSAGLAVDVGRLYATKAELSRSVDAAALAGVLEFNGTSGGLTNASNKACAYLQANEPTVSCGGISPNGGNSTLTIQASKSVRLYFLPIFGLNSASVSAKAVSGFNNATVDAALVIDGTGSMNGTPVQQAKIAATNFKNTLLGSSPTGNVVVGLAAFRGCYRAATTAATTPWANSHSNCTPTSEVTALSYDSAALGTGISNICPGDSCTGGSGTNVCGGLAKGWEQLEGGGNHTAQPNNRRFLVVLSDGDNNYNGAYSYQTSLPSPHTYQTNSCMPPSSCSSVGGSSTGSNPCQDGLWTAAASESSENWSSSCSGSWSGGSGWTASWTRSPTSGNDSATQLSTSTPFDTSCHVRLRGTGSMCRGVNLSGVYAAQLTYYTKINSWESSDHGYLEVNTGSCAAGSGWTTLKTHDNSTSTSYGSPTTIDLTGYVGATVYLRWRGGMSAGSSGDDWFIDNIDVTSGSSGSSDGYLNGSDNSNSCGSSVKRERQVDTLTKSMANAIKADNIEIFVVGFGVCSPNTNTMTSTDCSSNIGNSDADSIADQRLLKCIASSTAGTNDHYYYAAQASDLPAIFTTIAAQIAHRLVE